MLNMINANTCLISHKARREAYTSEIDENGYCLKTLTATKKHNITAQPAGDREIDTLSVGGERIKDARKIYVNDGDFYSIMPSDIWVFDGQRFKCMKLDNRPWRNYCKAIVVRIDDQ